MSFCCQSFLLEQQLLVCWMLCVNWLLFSAAPSLLAVWESPKPSLFYYPLLRWCAAALWPSTCLTRNRKFSSEVIRACWGGNEGVRKRPKHIYFLLEANEFTLTLNLKKDKTWNNSQLFIRTIFFRLEVLDQEKAGLCFSVFLYESLLMPWIH